MKRSFIIAAVLAAIHCPPLQAGAETFYLKDGGEIDCQSYWQNDGRFFVRINRETVVDFSLDEADPVKNRKAEKPAKKTGQRQEAVRTVPPKAPAAPAAGMPKLPPVKEKAAPVGAATAPATLPAQTGVADLRNQLVAVYDRYHQAALAGEFDEQLKWVTTKRQGKMQAVMDNIPENKKTEMKELMKEMTARSYIVTGMQVTSGGRRAVLTLEGRVSFMGKDSFSDGTVDFLKEGSEWKIDKVEWNSRG